MISFDTKFGHITSEEADQIIRDYAVALIQNWASAEADGGFQLNVEVSCYASDKSVPVKFQIGGKYGQKMVEASGAEKALNIYLRRLDEDRANAPLLLTSR